MKNKDSVFLKNNHDNYEVPRSVLDDALQQMYKDSIAAKPKKSFRLGLFMTSFSWAISCVVIFCTMFFVVLTVITDDKYYNPDVDIEVISCNYEELDKTKINSIEEYDRLNQTDYAYFRDYEITESYSLQFEAKDVMVEEYYLYQEIEIIFQALDVDYRINNIHNVKRYDFKTQINNIDFNYTHIDNVCYAFYKTKDYKYYFTVKSSDEALLTEIFTHFFKTSLL